MKKPNKLFFLLVVLCFPLIFNRCSGQFSEGKSIKTGQAHFAQLLKSLSLADRDAAVQQYIMQHPNTPVIESDSIADLYYYGKAQQVLITGDLQNGWSQPDTMDTILCGEKSFFHIRYYLPSDARIDYQLIVDSVYMTDPRNWKITPSGFGPHSEIAMPHFRPDAARARFSGVPRGTIDSMMFTSENPQILPRTIKVYVPANYDGRDNMPVLYVVDGLEALEWMNFQNVLDNLIAWNRIRPVIVAFIPPAERIEELMGGKYKDFQDVLCKEIVPLIDRKYATDARAESRGITGISAGGYFGLMTMLERNDVFGCGAGQSPSITGQVFNSLKKMVDDDRYHPALKVYFDMGRYDLPAGILGENTFFDNGKKLHEEMASLNVNHKFIVLNDGHEWANWRERTDEILEYFFPLTEQ